MQIRKLLFLLFLVSLFNLTYGQTKAKDKDNVIAKFDDQKITLEDFSDAYSKNGMSDRNVKTDSLSDLKNFLDLYVNYRMKLKYAKDNGLFKDEEILNEVKNYKNQLLVSTYMEKYFTQPNLERLYERRKWEIRLSHILFTPQADDSAATLKLANAVLDSIKNGADFVQMAERYSKDPNSRLNGGDIYYLTAGQLPLDIENVIYSIPEGTVYPKIFRSSFGYHIFKVTEKRKRIPEIRASHILLIYKQNGKIDTAAARSIVDTVYEKLMAGEDFAKLAEKYSNDLGSAKKGGDLGYFDRNRMIPKFAEAAFNLKNIGDISPIVQTQFGFHIIKLTGKKEYPTFEENKAKLQEMFKNGQQKEATKQIIDSLKLKANLKINKNLIKEIETRIDSSKKGFDIKELPESLKKETLFSYDGKNISVSDYANIVKNLSAEENATVTSMAFGLSVEKMAEKLIILDNAEAVKDSLIPNLDSALDDYLNGAVIFKIQQTEVWNKLSADSSKLYNFYKKNKENYKWPDRVEFTEFFTKNDSMLNAMQNEIKNNANFDTLCAKYTERAGYAQKAGKWELKDKDTNELYKEAWKLKNAGDFSKPISNSGGFSIIRLDKKDPVHIKAFDEAKQEIIANFQEEETKKLETSFAQLLKNKYKPVIYYDKLESLKN